MKRLRSVLFLLGGIALLLACNKDELTVVSTGPTGGHQCQERLVELDVDSLFSDPPPQPWETDIDIEVCECDTLLLRPVNIRQGYEFERWTIDQGEDQVYQYELNLDTLTVSTALRLSFDHGQHHPNLRIAVDFVPCE